MRDIDQVIQSVSKISPAVTVRQLSVSHPGDDDGLWFFVQPDCEFGVQIESATGMCPFLIETDENDSRFTATSVAMAVEAIASLLHLASTG